MVERSLKKEKGRLMRRHYLPENIQNCADLLVKRAKEAKCRKNAASK